MRSSDRSSRPAPEFSLEDTDGTVWRLRDLVGRWSLLVFHRHLA